MDEYLKGFQPRCIYEIYGPPGIGKTKFGVQFLNANSSQCTSLWIDTFQQVPIAQLQDLKCNLTRIKKFTQLWYFFQQLDESYDIIVIDGLSQLVTDYLQVCSKNQNGSSRSSKMHLHEFKVKILIQLMVVITKYATKHNSVVILLNEAMNTGYQDYSDDTFVSYNDSLSSGFLVKSQKKRHVQVLKSGLVANSAVGSKDSRWEVFLRCRIGLFWNWDPVGTKRIPDVLRKFVVQLAGSSTKNIFVSIDSQGNFCDYKNNELLGNDGDYDDANANLFSKNVDMFQMQPRRNILIASDSSNSLSVLQCLPNTPTPSLVLDVNGSKKRRLINGRPLSTCHSQPQTPISSQSIQFTPRIIHSDTLLQQVTTNQENQEDIVYDSEG